MDNSNQLVTIENNVPITVSYTVAEQLGIEHKSLMQLIKDHRARIEKHFGVLRFENDKPLLDSVGGRPEHSCELTENQAYYVLTLSRNTDKSMEVKAIFVKAFAEARQHLTQLTISPLAGEWTPDIANDPRRLSLAIKCERAKLRYLQAEMALRYPGRVRLTVVKQLAGPKTPPDIQSEILRHVARLGELTLNTLSNSYMKTFDNQEIAENVALLVEQGRVCKITTSHATKYFLPDDHAIA